MWLNQLTWLMSSLSSSSRTIVFFSVFCLHFVWFAYHILPTHQTNKTIQMRLNANQAGHPTPTVPPTTPSAATAASILAAAFNSAATSGPTRMHHVTRLQRRKEVECRVTNSPAGLAVDTYAALRKQVSSGASWIIIWEWKRNVGLQQSLVISRGSLTLLIT